MISGREDGSVPGHRHDNPDYYFHQGVTWTDITSGKFAARISPGGFIFDVSGSSAFPENIELILGIMNSTLAQYILKLINPTLHVQVGDLSRLPVPDSSSPKIEKMVKKAVELAKDDSEDSETTYDFSSPPSWQTGIEDVAARHQQLAKIEQQIDDEVYRLYGIADKDRAAIEAELSDAGGDAETNEPAAPFTREELAGKWISYAVGVVMGRFQPGIEGGLGRGGFDEDTAEKLRNLADSDGVMVLDEGHPDDLAANVFRALQIMLGENDAPDVVSLCAGKFGNPEAGLRKYFEGRFFKEHVKQYRKRPVYWLLQSPKKQYAVWLFHEKLTRDTLYRVRGESYVESKLNLLDAQLNDLRKQRDAAEGRERRKLEKQMADTGDVLEDVRAFAQKIDAVLQRGYVPHIDDGVLINMAPLWELVPSWRAEPKKCWKALEKGDYDWSHQAMDHWPDRVREKCETNRSFAIAHGLEE